MLMANPRRVCVRAASSVRCGVTTSRRRAMRFEVYVGYLRRKTEADGEPRLIHTVRGVGYSCWRTPP
ncbi:hypothetical protein GS447_07975 [Rhodococcus hoagii]|nr:hypothetical protein [Prescottella equi]